jgi:hypothetical protein
MRQLLMFLVLVPIGLLVLALIGVLTPMLRWAFRLSVAGLAALVAALVLPLGEGEGWVPFAVFAGTVVLLATRSDRRRRRRAPAPAAARIIENAAPPAPEPGVLGPAWRELRGLADWRSRRRLDAAWDACARYLLVADAQEDPSAQLPIKIRKHLPAIVDDCVRHSRTASADERRTLLVETLGTFESLAGRAEARRRELAHFAQGEFRARQAHLNRPED